jgi:uncharacterized peroxidase-related enzyme
MSDDRYIMKSGLVEQSSNDWVNTLYERSRSETKMVPNLFKVMANAPEVLQTYLDAYTMFSQSSGFTAKEQQIIFLIISYENGCDYCLAAHSTVADFTAKVDPAITDAIRNDLAIPDEKYRILADFTREMLWTRGRPSAEKVEEFLLAGYTEKQILDIVLAISAKTLSNYTNHLFNTPVDPVFKAREFKLVQFATRVFQLFSPKK